MRARGGGPKTPPTLVNVHYDWCHNVCTANLPDGISGLLDHVLLARDFFPVVVGDEAGEGSAAAFLHILPRQLDHVRKEDISTLVVHLVETGRVHHYHYSNNGYVTLTQHGCNRSSLACLLRPRRLASEARTNSFRSRVHMTFAFKCWDFPSIADTPIANGHTEL